jgi:hypothetical protein
VFGDASGAEDDSNPAINRSISDTFVFAVKLLKYEPFKLVCHAFEVGIPLVIFDAEIDVEIPLLAVIVVAIIAVDDIFPNTFTDPVTFTPLCDTNNDPVIIADPLNGNPVPVPPLAFNA